MIPDARVIMPIAALLLVGLLLAGGVQARAATPWDSGWLLGPQGDTEGLGNVFGPSYAPDIALLQDTGMNLVRVDLAWGILEKQKGQYDFTSIDRFVDEMESLGVTSLLIVDYGNNLYPQPDQDMAGFLAGYRAFVEAAVTHYRGRKVIWDLWNEPNSGFWFSHPDVSQYMQWANVVGPLLKQLDPQAVVIGPSNAGLDRPFMEECLRQGLLDYVDAVSFHPYRANQPPETAGRDYDLAEALIARYRPGAAVPLFQSEWGYDADIGREKQAEYLARMFLFDLCRGVAGTMWYTWRERPSTGPGSTAGMVDAESQPKPAYFAARTLTNELRGFRFARRVGVTRDPNLYALLFTDQAEPPNWKLALWNAGPAPVACDWLADLRVTRCLDYLGNPLPPAELRELTSQPVYLTLAELPAWLQVGSALSARVEGYFVAAGPEEREEGHPVMRFDLRNPLASPLRVTLATQGPAPRGEWRRGEAAGQAGGLAVNLAPGEQVTVRWVGYPARRDAEYLRVGFRASAAWGEETRPYYWSAEFSVTNPLRLAVEPWPDHLSVVVDDPAGQGLNAQVALQVKGEQLPPRPLHLSAGETSGGVEFPLPPGVSLAPGAALPVAARVEPSGGGEPLVGLEQTVTLVDDFADTAPGDYQLSIGGTPGLGGEATVLAAPAPGEEPPWPQALEVDYRFAEGWNYAEIQSAAPGPQFADLPSLGMWVYGDGSGNGLAARFQDATGQVFQLWGGVINFTGWKFVVFPAEQRGTYWGGAADGVPHGPLRLSSALLVDHNGAREGKVYVTGYCALGAAPLASPPPAAEGEAP